MLKSQRYRETPGKLQSPSKVGTHSPFWASKEAFFWKPPYPFCCLHRHFLLNNTVWGREFSWGYFNVKGNYCPCVKYIYIGEKEALNKRLNFSEIVHHLLWQRGPLIPEENQRHREKPSEQRRGPTTNSTLNANLTQNLRFEPGWYWWKAHSTILAPLMFLLESVNNEPFLHCRWLKFSFALL